MAFIVWLLLGVSVTYWGIQFLARPQGTPPEAVAATESHAARADLSRLLGVTPVQAATAEPEAPTSSRLRLLGVVAPRSDRAAQAGEGVALIEVDGVARTVRVGAKIDGDLQLLRVDAKGASIGLPGQAPSQVLQLAPLPAAATGALMPAAPSPVSLGAIPENMGGRQPGMDAGMARANGGVPPSPPMGEAPTAYGAPVTPAPPNSTDNLPRRR